MELQKKYSDFAFCAGSDVLGLVKSYIDSDTCNPVTYTNYSASLCRDNAKSFYKEFIYKAKRVIVTNNVGYNID